jgi:hypothetical protein
MPGCPSSWGWEALELRSMGSSAAFSQSQVMSVHELTIRLIAQMRRDDMASFESRWQPLFRGDVFLGKSAVAVALGIKIWTPMRPTRMYRSHYFVYAQFCIEA